MGLEGNYFSNSSISSPRREWYGYPQSDPSFTSISRQSWMSYPSATGDDASSGSIQAPPTAAVKISHSSNRISASGSITVYREEDVYAGI